MIKDENFEENAEYQAKTFEKQEDNLIYNISSLKTIQTQYLKALIVFKQEISGDFFNVGNYDKFKNEISEIEKSWLKAKEDNKKLFIAYKDKLAKLLDKYCSISGKSLLLVISNKLNNCNSVSEFGDIVEWTFKTSEVYFDGMYDWMYDYEH